MAITAAKIISIISFFAASIKLGFAGLRQHVIALALQNEQIKTKQKKPSRALAVFGSCNKGRKNWRNKWQKPKKTMKKKSR